MRKHFWVQGLGLAHKTDEVVGQRHIISLWQDIFRLEIAEKVLPDSRVGTVGSNKDIAMVSGVVRTPDHDTVLILQKGHDLLAHVDPFLGNLAQQQIVQVWSRDNKPRSSRAVPSCCMFCLRINRDTTSVSQGAT
jgi:hypothetical protein